MAVPARVHDPLFHFETHFPERLSRLHLNPEFSGGNHPVQRKNKRSRAARQGVRYKTQPVTFDEIQEVDEENVKEQQQPEDKTDGLKHQFAAFSKSMDGLVPKHKSKLPADTIKEVADDTSIDIRQPSNRNSDMGRVNADSPELRLQSNVNSKENKENEPSNGANPENLPLGLPPSGPNTRRQRTTAKAKKRQMQTEVVPDGGDKGT
ncbi:hypothetical protein ACF0H5_008069 [Mactra antiquata]